MEDDNAHYWHPDHPFPPPGLPLFHSLEFNLTSLGVPADLANQGRKDHLQRVTARAQEDKSLCYMP
jgi:hypothetical protein